MDTRNVYFTRLANVVIEDYEKIHTHVEEIAMKVDNSKMLWCTTDFM